jgi:hypothetical protein
MRTPKINAKKLVAALAPVALAGAVMAPTAAAESTPTEPNGPAATAQAEANSPAATAPTNVACCSKGFRIYNLSSHPIKLINITGDGNFDGRPADGAVLKPGEVTDVEVVERFCCNDNDTAHFAILDAKGAQIGTYEVNMHVEGPHDSSTCAASIGQCTADEQGNLGSPRPNTLADPPGTEIPLGPDQKQAQAQVLNQLCQAGAASCSFTLTKEEREAWSPEHQVGNTVENHTNEPSKTDLEWVDAFDVKDSYEVGAKVGVNIFEMVEAEVSATYGHEVTKSHEFKQTLGLDVDPGYEGWVTDIAPVIRDTGNFTVKLENTTWNLTGVYFESPDPTRNGRFKEYTKKMEN